MSCCKTSMLHPHLGGTPVRRLLTNVAPNRDHLAYDVEAEEGRRVIDIFAVGPSKFVVSDHQRVGTYSPDCPLHPKMPAEDSDRGLISVPHPIERCK